MDEALQLLPATVRIDAPHRSLALLALKRFVAGRAQLWEDNRLLLSSAGLADHLDHLGNHITGSLHLCIPYATLEPIRDVLYSSVQGDAIEVDRRWVKLLGQEIQAAEVTMVAELAQTDATVEQLLAMQVGDFIELDRNPAIKAHVDGVPLFECQYGTHKGKYALRIDRKLSSSTDKTWQGDPYVH